MVGKICQLNITDLVTDDARQTSWNFEKLLSFPYQNISVMFYPLWSYGILQLAINQALKSLTGFTLTSIHV